MVFVYIPHRGRNAQFELTPEETALVAKLQAKGLAGEDLEAALTASGVTPDRAHRIVQGRSAGAGPILAALAGSWLAVGLAVLFALGKEPLRDWLRREHPGSEWLAGAAFPLLLVVLVAWKFMEKRRREHDAPESTTRADRIENRPIG